LNILIFGGLGRTAAPIVDMLNMEKHTITLFDIAENTSFSRNENIKVIRGDICDSEAVNNALYGTDVIIHLAVNILDIGDDELTFRTNAFGTYNILRGALNNNVSKILVASSAPVHTMDEMANRDDYICSAGEDFAYDLTKNMQKLIAKHFSRTYSMNCLVLRLGHIVDGRNRTSLSGAPLSELTYCKGGWVCKYDVAKAFTKAIETDFTGYHLVHIIGSYQAADLFDLSSAKEFIGFTCQQKFFEY